MVDMTEASTACADALLVPVAVPAVAAAVCECRCGADYATAVESVRHMADTANHTVALNNLSKQISVVHKDARFLSSDDIQGGADLVVFEVSQHPCRSQQGYSELKQNMDLPTC
jgi:hypothetical protein